MAKDPTQKLLTPMIAFSRSIEPTEAMMYGLKSSDTSERFPIQVVEKGVRGQSSHAKPGKGDFKPGMSNPQVVDSAMLPPGCDMLEISFSLTFLNNAFNASSCDSNEVRSNINRLVSLYAEHDGFAELAERYVGQLAAGRFAWRNRTVTRKATVFIEFDGKSVEFDPYKISLETMPTFSDIIAAELSNDNAASLIEYVKNGLTGDPATIKVTWRSSMPEGSEVYPSQEYVREGAQRKNVSRTLSSVDREVNGRIVRCATLHTQKVGAAIRCIDDWHGDDRFYGLPVPVNPYAGVQEAGIALRYGTDAKSFFDIARKPEKIWQAAESGELIDDLHFYVANLVRGGVYGEKGEK